MVLGALWFIIRTPVRPNVNSVEFHASVVLDYSSCGVRIELAVGSLPYPRQSEVPTTQPVKLDLNKKSLPKQKTIQNFTIDAQGFR